MFYNARWYDPYLNHFVQADSNVPLKQGMQAWDRYAYVNNNPVRYNDPTGHEIGSMYQQGWANFSSAWSIVTNGNASLGDRALASTYVVAWGGAHVLGAAGLVLGGIATVKAITAAACADTDCTNEAASVVKAACQGDCSDEASSLKSTISSGSQALLEKLPNAGSSTSVPSGQINSGIMAELQHFTGDEFALVRAQGERLLVRGGLGNVQLPTGVTRIIAHTHPWFASTVPSRMDINTLKEIGQRWSIIISEYGSVGKFFAE
jgi:hypothetical protein